MAQAPGFPVERSVAPLLALQHLSVDFPTIAGPAGAQVDRPALRDISFDVAGGEILGLVGESGAGKTVLARTILGLPPPPARVTGGAVRFKNQDLLRLREDELRRMRGRDLAMVVPNPRGELNPVRTVGEQIAGVARAHLGIGKRQARRMALDMLKSVQIPDPERRIVAYPHELSGGMAQRVVLAIALICEPDFIISDDATSGLDVTVQAQILSLMRKLAAERHSAMLFITRDVGVAAHFCDRVAVLFAGQLMEIAPREPFFLDPHHPYTVMLLSAFAHNKELRRQWSIAAAPGAALPSEGCLYAGRCPQAQDRCRAERPALRELAPGHAVRCHFPVMRA